MPEPQKNKRPRDAAKTRQLILEAAKKAFSRYSYEQIGVREIAAAAGVDAALVNRYFGSKEGLFREALSGVFEIEAYLFDPIEDFLTKLADHILNDGCQKEYHQDIEPLAIVLRSAVSPTASPIVSQIFQKEFVGPLAKRLTGPDQQAKAGLIGAYLLGFGTMKKALNSPGLASPQSKTIITLFHQAIQSCLMPGPPNPPPLTAEPLF